MPTFDITSFFIAGEDWTPGLEIPNPEFANITDVFDDEDTDSQEKVHMGNVRLCDLLAGEGSHLRFTITTFFQIVRFILRLRLW